jgi:hypothetical protein
VTDHDPDARLPSGLTLREAARLASAWWDRTGRHIARNPEFRNPDVGFASGILRGVAWEHLTGDERRAVVATWDAVQAPSLTIGAPAPAPARRIVATPRRDP